MHGAAASANVNSRPMASSEARLYCQRRKQKVLCDEMGRGAGWEAQEVRTLHAR
jgi:hypothetical protein